jgi:hypothetical protein
VIVSLSRAEHTLRASSKLFSACRASPSETSARKGKRVEGIDRGGSGIDPRAFWRICTSSEGESLDKVNTLELGFGQLESILARLL